MHDDGRTLPPAAPPGEPTTIELDGEPVRAYAGEPVAVSLFIGPEGGFTPEEIAAARAQGITLVTLGPRVLRADTAATVALALTLAALGDLD